MPRFSVIIPTYNRYEKVKKAVQSVLDQSCRDFELIVVDDGSTDRTPEIEKDCGHSITYIRQENRGVSAARNTGIAASSARQIAFLDSDDLWHNDKLAAHSDFTSKHPEIPIHQTDEMWVRNGRRVNPKERHLKREGRIFTDSLHLCLVSPSAVMIDRSVFDRYGTFDEEMPVCEDYDLWLRISLHEEIGLIPEMHVTRFGGHEDQLSSSRWGMDRYRVYSILKILYYYHNMPDDYRKEACLVAARKCSILLKGAQKRKNHILVDALEDILTKLRDGCYNSINYQSLLKI